MYSYNVVTDDGEPLSVTVFFESDVGVPYVASREHPMFDDILARLQQGSHTDDIINLFDARAHIEAKFEKVSSKVMIDPRTSQIYFNGEVLHGSLADTVVRFHFEGNENFLPMVSFLEKVQANPNKHSQEHLFRWLEKHSFSIDADGDIIAYKGVQNDGKYSSLHRGEAYVNGKLITGLIPNKPGTIVSMTRDSVQFDPGVGCSTGLHAGNYRYAKSFGKILLHVKIDPSDVVSVPVDSNDEKMRVCKYRIMGEVTSERTQLLYS